jgi:hypothetical protein
MKKSLFFLLFISSGVFAQTGIGTTTPVNKFQIEATTANPSSTGSSTNGNLRISGTGATHVLDFGLSSTSTFSWLQARSKSDYATLYDLAFNPNGGKVGIGTTAPSTTLTVGNTAGTIGGEILLNPTSTQYEGGQIVFKRSLIGSTVDWTLDQYGSTSANARFRIFNGASETNGLAILENGNVGIGTANPTAKLNLVGGGIRIFAGFGNTTSRPSLNNGSIGNYEIRGVGAGGGTSQGDGYDDGFLRLSAGGGTSSNTQSSIDLTGYSNVSDMQSNIVMRTSGTDRVRIDNVGNLGLGTSPNVRFQVLGSDQTTVYIESTTSDNNGLMILNANTNQNWEKGWHEFLRFQNQGTTIGQVYQTNSSTINYATTSDYRLKTDFKRFNGMALINKMKIYDYAWKANNSRNYGVKAHELQEVLPYLVSGKKDEVDQNGVIIPQTVDYGKLTPVIIKALQEQAEKIESLENRIKKLETLLNKKSKK